MKKFIKITLSIIGILFLCLMILGQVAQIFMKPAIEQATQRSEFERMIERADRDCPIPAVMGKGAITGIKLEKGYVTYYLSYDSGFLNVLSKVGDDERVKEALLMCFLCINAQGNNQGDVVMDALIKFGYGLRVKITESAIGRFECSASVNDIKSLRERYNLNPQEALYNLLTISIEADRTSLPVQLDEGVEMTDYKLEGDNIAIVVKIDEDLYSIGAMYDNREIIKASMIEEGLSQPESKALLDLCKISHTGLIYRFLGSYSREKIEIVLSSEEIRQIVQTPASVNIR